MAGADRMGYGLMAGHARTCACTTLHAHTVRNILYEGNRRRRVACAVDTSKRLKQANSCGGHTLRKDQSARQEHRARELDHKTDQ